MKACFNIPNSPKIIVKYKANGVNYSTIIPTPRDNDGLAMAMLAKKVGMSQISDVQEFVPRVALR